MQYVNKLLAEDINRHIILDEWGRSELIPLEARDIEFIQDEVNKIENSRITLIPKGSGIILEAKNWVGAFSLPSGKIVHIEPKLELNFFKMVAYVLDIQDLEFLKGEATAKPGSILIDLVAKLFLDKYQEIEKMGIIKRYTSVDENLNLVRGRILFQQQFRRNIASDHLTFCSFDELSTDVIENRALLFAANILKNLVQAERLRKDLFEMILTLTTLGVTLSSVTSYEVEIVVFSRLNAYYEPILRLCKFIIENTWIEELWEEGNFVTSFLMDMNQLFEGFVTKLLQESLQEYTVEPQRAFKNSLVTKPDKVRNLELTQNLLRNVTIKPDIVVKKQNNRQIIIDAKYKRDFSDSDIHQAIAYSLALEAPTLLVLPEDIKPIFGCYQVTQIPESKIFLLTLNLNSPEKTFEEFIAHLKTELSTKLPLIIEATASIS